MRLDSGTRRRQTRGRWWAMERSDSSRFFRVLWGGGGGRGRYRPCLGSWPGGLGLAGFLNLFEFGGADLVSFPAVSVGKQLCCYRLLVWWWGWMEVVAMNIRHHAAPHRCMEFSKFDTQLYIFLRLTPILKIGMRIQISSIQNTFSYFSLQPLVK